MSDHDDDGGRVIHEVDGIQEYDNKLPNWWLYTLYGTVVFAVLYWFHYHQTKFGDLPPVEYQNEMDRFAEEEAKRAGPITADKLVLASKDPAKVQQGKEIFSATCAACHRADGGGSVGPNLTDEFWLHGGGPEAIFKTVSDGFAAKGMPAWRPQLGIVRVQAVTAYILTLRNTHVPGGKAPQGERETLTLKE
jgi:cytochrome c oxidase cbb3-type subunit 3